MKLIFAIVVIAILPLVLMLVGKLFKQPTRWSFAFTEWSQLLFVGVGSLLVLKRFDLAVPAIVAGVTLQVYASFVRDKERRG